MKSKEKLLNALKGKKHICVGLDTDINKIPKHLLRKDNPVLEFNKSVIESTKEFAAAYKINLAFYEKEGSGGLKYLEETMKIIPSDVLIIGDAKRGDIGNTSQMYAQSLYEHFNFDSVTLNPYMGFDSVQPFLEYADKVNFILALTSNQSSVDFEKQRLQSGEFLFMKVIQKINEWNKNKNCGIVFGATHSDELANSISSFNDLFVLLPGIGTQGGSIKDVVEVFTKANNNRYIINVSRALIYADNSENFQIAVHKKIRELHSQVLLSS
jgi:orotidine-5'-phosphate decarboxylase